MSTTTGILGSLQWTPAAPALRVTLGATVFVLLVGWSERCGCPECGSQPRLSVLEVKR